MAIVIIRTFIVYFSLLLSMRLLGKRQLGEMELSEFLVAALIADLASHPLQDMGIPLMNGILPIMVLFCCEVLISGIALKNVRFRGIIYGKPSFLIVNGKIMQNEMHKNRFTCDELMQELRNQSYLDISKIQYAILETDGRLNVIPFPWENPVTPSILKLDVCKTGYPVIVIDDGRLMADNLQKLGKDENWLHKQLASNNIKSRKDVFLMTVSEDDKIFLCEREINK